MKYFAVKPDNFKLNIIIDKLQDLSKSGVDYLYLRNVLDKADLRTIIKAVNETQIIPIVSLQASCKIEGLTYGIHYKNSNLGHIHKRNAEYSVLTASAHDYDTAVYLIENGIDYVYVSPVFKPLSKKNDKRELFSQNKIKKLIDDFGERIILLGGLTHDRIDELKKVMKNDFSVAGITMFFG